MRIVILATLAFLMASPIAASDIRIGLRGGSAQISNDAYEVVYDEALPVYGASAGFHWGHGWSVTLAGERGDVDGFLVVPTDPPSSTEDATRFETTLIHLTVAYDFRIGERWSIGAGLGATQLAWEEASEFFETSGSGTGGHARIDGRFHAGRFDIGPEVTYWMVPDALSDGGAATQLNDLDLSALQVSLTAGWRF